MKTHGHVIPNLDGSLARCGGPAICTTCAAEKAQLDWELPVKGPLALVQGYIRGLCSRLDQNPDPAILSVIKKLSDQQLGPTGEFPNGKLAPDDKGQLAVGIQTDLEKRVVRFFFGTPVQWMALDVPDLERMILTLQEKRKELGT